MEAPFELYSPLWKPKDFKAPFAFSNNPLGNLYQLDDPLVEGLAVFLKGSSLPDDLVDILAGFFLTHDLGVLRSIFIFLTGVS